MRRISGLSEQGSRGEGVLEKIGIVCYQEQGGEIEAGLVRISGLSGAGQWGRGSFEKKGRWKAMGCIRE